MPATELLQRAKKPYILETAATYQAPSTHTSCHKAVSTISFVLASSLADIEQFTDSRLDAT